MTDSITNTILEQLDTLVVTVNRAGNVEYVSPSARRLLGFDDRSLLGEGWWNLTRKGESSILHKAEIVKIFNDPENYRTLSFERELLAADGRKKWILWSISVSTDDVIVGVGQDITQQKQIQQQLLRRSEEVLRQKTIIEQKNKDITDSIVYAKKIQSAILPEEDGLRNYFSDAFILYKPKDIVSGDFYWYYKTRGKIFVAAADCTGHGVPGAIMSVIGNGLLRDAVLKSALDDPAEILSLIDRELEVLLNKEGSEITQDGMDVALAVFDLEKSQLTFAGAFRPLIIVRNSEVSEVRGNRFPIGFYESCDKKFDSTILSIEKGDRFYLLSDGYCDQFGGEKGKKLNRARLNEFLLGSADMSMEEQGAYLDYSLNNWKQDEPQTDDVLVIGVEL